MGVVHGDALELAGCFFAFFLIFLTSFFSLFWGEVLSNYKSLVGFWGFRAYVLSIFQ